MIPEVIRKALELSIYTNFRMLCGSNRQRLEIVGFDDFDPIQTVNENKKKKKWKSSR